MAERTEMELLVERVDAASVEQAVENVLALLKDAGVEATVRPAERRDDGRFRFQLERSGYVCELDMPGLPLERVAGFTGARDQNVWDFPRVYVGSSCLWYSAVKQVRRALRG